MDYRSLLNNKQYEAVATESQYVRIIAGAGSGKTRVLTYRISYLISELGVKPSSILAIAFTNKVAAEMKERATNLVREAKNSQISTFHSFCARFLRQEIDLIGFPNNFQIIDDEDQLQMIKDIAQREGYKKNDEIVKSSLAFISNNKCKGYYPDDITLPQRHDPKDVDRLKFFHLYEDEKERMVKVDFDDLLLKTIQILEQFPDIREKWSRKFSNILIDEFQDTNDVQFKLVKLLLNQNTNLYVVGDPDQTIYTWRGANQDIILSFDTAFIDAETITLAENYRSTSNILGCANKLIANNKKRLPKDLFTKNGDGDKVSYQRFLSKENEARNIASQIDILRRTNRDFQYRDVAILYRASYLTLPIEKEFMQRQLKYEIFGGVKFFQRREVKDILAYFNLIYNPEDDLSFKRIVNVPKRGIGEGALDALTVEKENAGLSYYNYVKNIDSFNTELKTKNILAIQNFINKIEGVKQKLNENVEAYPNLLNEFIEDLGYFEYLKSDDDADDRIKNVNALFDDILSFVKNHPDSNFQQYLENASLATSQDDIKDGDYVSLMTIHVAKGLEFKYVFVIGLSEGIFPSDRTIAESIDGLEEERRLCYVAFTRAKKRLFVSSNQSYSYVAGGTPAESQFVREAGLTKPTEQSIFNRPLNQSPSQVRQQNPFRQYSYMDFKEDDEEIETPKPKENGIKNWSVGDKVIHDKFGHGVITKIVADTIVEIDFDAVGKKSIISTHIMLHRDNGGFDA